MSWPWVALILAPSAVAGLIGVLLWLRWYNRRPPPD
jgi:hypothetical protein